LQVEKGLKKRKRKRKKRPKPKKGKDNNGGTDLSTFLQKTHKWMEEMGWDL